MMSGKIWAGIGGATIASSIIIGGITWSADRIVKMIDGKDARIGELTERVNRLQDTITKELVSQCSGLRVRRDENHLANNPASADQARQGMQELNCAAIRLPDAASARP